MLLLGNARPHKNGEKKDDSLQSLSFGEPENVSSNK